MGRLMDKIRGKPYERYEQPPVDNIPYYSPVPSETRPEYYEEIPEEYLQRGIPEQYYQPEYIEEDVDIKEAPMSIIKDIKNDPSPKGTYPTVIGGIPADLHVLEDYVIRSSPYALKTILRYHHARDVEEMKGYGRSRMNIDSKTIILILLAVGMAVLGIFVIMFLPNILRMFQGGI